MVVGWVGRKHCCSALGVYRERGDLMDLLTELRNIVPDEDRIYVDGEELERHGRVFSYHAPRSPDAVVFPKKRDEAAEILRFANRSAVPVVPYGEGSSLRSEERRVGKERRSRWSPYHSKK